MTVYPAPERDTTFFFLNVPDWIDGAFVFRFENLGYALKLFYGDDSINVVRVVTIDRVPRVVAFGQILPPWLLELPRLGCLNIHASLLPGWRGAAPIQRAIEAGDSETGVTIMQMDAGLDTGDMLRVGREPIGASDTAASLHDRLAELGATLIVQALADAARGALVRTPQPADGVTYAHKLAKSEAAIDWRRPADEIERRASALIRQIDDLGGAVRAIESGWMQTQIAEASYRYQKEIEAGEVP